MFEWIQSSFKCLSRHRHHVALTCFVYSFRVGSIFRILLYLHQFESVIKETFHFFFSFKNLDFYRIFVENISIGFFRQSPITLMIYLFFLCFLRCILLCLLLLFFYFLFQFMFSFIYSFGSRSGPGSPGRPGPARPISTPLLPITTIWKRKMFILYIYK